MLKRVEVVGTKGGALSGKGSEGYVGGAEAVLYTNRQLGSGAARRYGPPAAAVFFKTPYLASVTVIVCTRRHAAHAAQRKCYLGSPRPRPDAEAMGWAGLWRDRVGRGKGAPK